MPARASDMGRAQCFIGDIHVTGEQTRQPASQTSLGL